LINVKIIIITKEFDDSVGGVDTKQVTKVWCQCS